MMIRGTYGSDLRNYGYGLNSSAYDAMGDSWFGV